jgi:hypothetical protein
MWTASITHMKPNSAIVMGEFWLKRIPFKDNIVPII